MSQYFLKETQKIMWKKNPIHFLSSTLGDAPLFPSWFGTHGSEFICYQHNEVKQGDDEIGLSKVISSPLISIGNLNFMATFSTKLPITKLA